MAREGVSQFQFGVFSGFHDELLVAEVTESAAAVGLPRYGDAVADIQVICFYERRQHGVGAIVLSEMDEEIVPVLESKELGEDDQGAVSNGSHALEVAPKAFQGGGTQLFVGAFPDDVAKSVEIGWRFGLYAGAFLDSFQELLYFWAIVVHVTSFYDAKVRRFGQKRKFFDYFC